MHDRNSATSRTLRCKRRFVNPLFLGYSDDYKWRDHDQPEDGTGLFSGGARYCAVMPPSKVRILPVAKRLSSLARNRIPAAISSGVPSRPRSWRAANALRVAAGSALALRMSLKYGVSIVPGAIALQRIPSPTWSMAIARVSAATAPFDAQ